MTSGFQVGKGFTIPVAVPNPSASMSFTINVASTGGSLASGTYYCVLTFFNANGETTACKEESFTATGTTSVANIQPNASTYPVGSIGCNVYVGTVSGQESFQGQITTPGNAFPLTSFTPGNRPVPQYNTTSFQDINPSTIGLSNTSEFIIHNIYYNNPVAIGTWDGTTLVMFDSDTNNGAREKVAHHCNNSQWVRVFNQNQYTQLQISFDGIQSQ